MKFYSSITDPVNGNDFVFKCFGCSPAKAERRHKQFKCFFTLHDPLEVMLPREIAPNQKVMPFLIHILKISQNAVFLGRRLSCDEQTQGFQGQCIFAQRITYKAEGDGFLADCICSDGYTYSFYFRHQPPSEKFIKEWNCSPLHSRVLAMVSQLPGKNYDITCDNLYMSTKLCRDGKKMKQSVNFHGVARHKNRGVPHVIKQQEVTRKADLASVRNTVKVAVLQGHKVCKDLVAVSIYDTKPVYFLSTSCEEIKWVKKTRAVYNAAKGKKVPMNFHRLNIIDFYNNNMGNVDIADQLRNHYRVDNKWLRNRKWWWSLWWWGFQTLLTNSYILYTKYHKMIKSPANTVLSHYDYIKMIALGWMDQENHWPQKKCTPVKKPRPNDEVASASTHTSASESSRRLRSTFSSSEPDPDFKRPARTMKFTDSSLSGTLGYRRLDNRQQHFPVKATVPKPICQLHRHVTGQRVMKGVSKCCVCNIHLCLGCYELFHTVEDKDSMMKEVAKLQIKK